VSSVDDSIFANRPIFDRITGGIANKIGNALLTYEVPANICSQ